MNMQTLRQVVSDLASTLKSVNLDDRISFRYLANVFRDKFSTFLRVEGRSRDVFKQAGIWQPLDCIELEDVSVTACGDIGDCQTLKRSVKKLPESYTTNYGVLLKILTINGLQEFKQIMQSFDYQDYVNREYGPTKEVFWLQDNYIYIPNTTVEAVRGVIIPKDPIAVDKANGRCNACASPLEAQLNYPDYLITLAKQEVLRDLGGVYVPKVEDERGDDNTNRKN